jgi:hypothetical protein
VHTVKNEHERERGSSVTEPSANPKASFSQRQLRAAAAALFLGLLIAIVAVSYASGSGTAPQTMPTLSKPAKLMASAPLADGKVGVVWSAPASDGKVCTFVASVPAASADIFRQDRGAENCLTPPPSGTEQPPISVNIEFTRNQQQTYDIMIDGAVTPNSGITSLALATVADGATRAVSTPIAIGGEGLFVAGLPQSSAAGQLPASARQATIIGYDEAGSRIASFSLNSLLERTHPG